MGKIKNMFAIPDLNCNYNTTQHPYKYFASHRGNFDIVVMCFDGIANFIFSSFIEHFERAG